MSKEYFIEHKHNLKCRLHVNAELEIVFVLNGSLTVESEGGVKTELNNGEAMLIFPYRVHSFDPSNGVDARVMMFPSSVVDQFCNNYRNCTFDSLSFKVDDDIARYCSYALDKYKRTQDMYAVKSLFFAFASAFSEQNKLVEKKRGEISDIARIMEYVCENIGESLMLSCTAKDLALSKNKLEKTIVEYTGTTFGKFLNNMRVEKAVTLLCATDKTVTEIAYECGFGSLRTFNRVFAAFFGKTPSAFKKEYYLS